MRHQEWESYRKEKPITDPAYYHRQHWQEIVDRPNNLGEAWNNLYLIVASEIERIKKLLAGHEATEAAEDTDWADRAAADTSAGFERLRRYQSAKRREMLKTLDAFCKMRQAGFGAEDGGCQMAGDEGQAADEAWLVVGQDSNPVLEDSMNDRIGILSHEGTDEEGRSRATT